MSEGCISVINRHESIEQPTTCMIRVKRGNTWYDQRPLRCSIAYSKKVIERLRRKGREVKVIWFSGLGLGGA